MLEALPVRRTAVVVDRSRRPTFVTLFPGARDYHLTKDVGMIAYVLGRYYGYDARIASFQNDPSCPALEDLPGPAVEAIPRQSGDDAADVLAYRAFSWRELGATIHRHLLRVQLPEGGNVSPAGLSSR